MPRRAVAGILLAFALPFPTPQQDRGVLLRAEIGIGLGEGDAAVDAVYTVAGAARLELVALSLPGQDLLFERATVNGRALEPVREATALRLIADAPADTATIIVRYRAGERLERIPLFVPSAPARPPANTVRIVVAGADPVTLASRTLPRFTRDPDGTLVASLEHVPSVVSVIARDAALPIPWIAEVAVLVIALGGTAFWVVRLARARRGTPEGL